MQPRGAVHHSGARVCSVRSAHGAAGAKDGKVIAANMWGKVKTVLQMLSIIFYFFGTALSYRGTVDSVSIVVVVSIALCWMVAAVTAISGIKYLWDNRSFINTAK